MKSVIAAKWVELETILLSENKPYMEIQVLHICRS
jgi:hypothetical protein